MKKLLKILIAILLIAVLVFVAINLYVVYVGGKSVIASSVGNEGMITKEEVEELEDYGISVALVLGAGLNEYGGPSQILQDRLDVAIFLYEEGAIEKIILSGDNGQETYNEVVPMYRYVVEQGVKGEDIFLDYAGFSTYESIYRAKEVFQVEEMIIVTQKFHQDRAGYIADSLGIEAVGIGANQNSDGIDWNMEIRESMARVKDFSFGIFKPEPTYLGEPIPITGNGEITHPEE